MMIDVERNTDYSYTPGSLASLTIGPFGFFVRTSDGGYIGFSITLFRWAVSWAFEDARP